MDYFVSKGSHATAEDGRCAMEFVAYLAGEPHSDSPVCVSPLLRGYGIALNDVLPDDLRQRLRPYLARCIGTAGDGRDMERSWLAMDWLIRTYVPAWLALTPALAGHASVLRALPPVLAAENLTRAMESLSAARDAAGAASWGAAGAAAGDAARDAAWDAAWDAARNAAWDAARDAAWDAARDAAWAAAWAAAGAAARAALAPTVRELQVSAIELLDQMLPTEAIEIPVAEDAELICGTA